MDYINFWKRTKPLIKAHKMTQKQFAEHMGISFHTFRGWIQHNRIPDLASAYDMALVLGVTLDYLVSGKDRDFAARRLKEIELRRAAARAIKHINGIKRDLEGMRPI